jgi:hypothetical protein
MDNRLDLLSETVRDSEYKDLFPATSPEDARSDREKVKEAIFQVHHMIYDENLRHFAVSADAGILELDRVLKHLKDMEDRERAKTLLAGDITTIEDGTEVVMRENILDILKTNREAVP